MGYYSTGSTAIKASHNLYNVCAEQMEINKEFYIKGKSDFDMGRVCMKTDPNYANFFLLLRKNAIFLIIFSLGFQSLNYMFGC